VNPAAPNRVPGGSSSGSAVAVAANCVDFALGTDTAGSVRVPAAFCGILGFRPSHAAISVTGVIPMAESFDTVGWFARDPKTLLQVGHSLLQLPYSDAKQPRRILVADDCFKLSLIPNEDTVGAVLRSVQKLLGRQVLQHVNLGEFVGRNVPSLKEFEKAISNGSSMGALPLLRTAMQLLQRWEFKKNHKEWLETTKPDLGADIAARAQAAIKSSGELVSLIQQIRNEARFAINDLLKNDTVMVMPTVPDIPPKLNTKPEALDEFRTRAFDLICVSGMSGCCQVHFLLCCRWAFLSISRVVL
jgi:amidase